MESIYYDLFELMSREHGLSLLETELQEIIQVSLEIAKDNDEVPDVVAITYTLQGRQGNQWRDITTCRTRGYDYAKSEKERYEEIKHETLYEEFRIVRDERAVVV